MKKQTITFTVLPKSISGAAGAGTLRLAAFMAPRLWTDVPAEQKQILRLDAFPAFLNWPTQVRAMQFRVHFEDGPTAPLPATVTSTADLREDLWQALFPDDIPVKPFRFDNAANVPIETFDTGWLNDWLRVLYRRVGTDPNYGRGADKPPLVVMRDDQDIKVVVDPYTSEPPYEPPGDQTSVNISPPTSEPPKPEHKCCLPGCLAPFLVVLNPILKLLGIKPPFQTQFAASPAHPTPAPTPAPSFFSPSATVNAAADATSAAAPKPAARAGGVLRDTPPSASALLAKAKIGQVVKFIKPFGPVTAVLPPLTDEELAKLLDFHEATAFCCDYPTLMPALGIVINLEVDWDAAIPPAGMMWLEVDAPQVETDCAAAKPKVENHLYTTRTHYELAMNRFVVPPRPTPAGKPETQDGLLLLSNTDRYKVVQADVVGATVKVKNTATSIMAPHDQSDGEPLPVLRTAGLSVVQADLAEQLYAGYLYAAGLHNQLTKTDGSLKVVVDPTPGRPVPDQPELTDELWAEEVVRGYRMDVRDLNSTSQHWRSLHQRTGKCLFTRKLPNIPFIIKDEEGFLQTAVAEPPEGPATVQRVHDAVATWTGWSLSAVRPGKALVESTDPTQTVGIVTNEAKTQFKMVADFTPVKGSLPRLRFGHTYRVRIRTVDLAGNSVFGPVDPEFQKDHPDQDSAEVTLRRHEPVASPAVVLRAKPIEGESAERLVLRSNPDDAASSINRLTTERHIIPPKESQQMAELHGEFDREHIMRQEKEDYDLASREAGTLTHGLNLNTGELELLDGVLFAANPADENGPTFWQTNAAFPLAYLPDDLARSVVLLGLPGMPASEVKDGVNRIAFDGAWPDRLPFRLAVKGIPWGQQPNPPAWTNDHTDPAQRRCLVVELPPAATATVRISCALDPADLGRMALWDWISVPKTTNYDDIVARTQQGRHWELMPYRELKLVHAVSKPLKAPVVKIQGADKQEKNTFVTFTAALHVDAASTGKVDLLAAWEDPVDEKSGDETIRKSRAVVGEWPVGDPRKDTLSIENARHDLGDTHYHAVTYVPQAATRFREYLPDSVKDDLNKITRPTPDEIKTGIDNGTLTNDVTNGVTVDVLSSARPAAPVVEYVFPTFGQVEETVFQVKGRGYVRIRVRRGNGLRVYLDRPWFSSGAGELLGVVFNKTGSFADLTEAMQPFVTQWANDPIWASAGADLSPMDASFVNYVAIKDAILEENGATVRVAGYPTEFVKLDEEHKLRYADILLNLGEAYTPMIRLAVVRFQPNSVDGLHISRVVRTDFCQVLPDRKLTLTKFKLLSDPSYHLKLEGLAPAKNQRTVSVRIEEQVEPGEFGWRQVEVGEQSQASAALWEGDFVLPQPPSGHPHRVVVEEVEVFKETSISELGSVVHGRTVYADIVEL